MSDLATDGRGLHSKVSICMKQKIQSLFNDPQAPYFMVIMLVFGVSTGLFLGVLNNYLHEILSISKMERGMVELPRELPGLLLFLLVALMSRFCEVRILRFGFVIALAGIVGLILVGDMRYPAIAMIVLWSTGEHLMMPLRQSMGIHMAKPGKEGVSLGIVRSMGNIGQVIGFYLIPILFVILPFQVFKNISFTRFQIIFGIGVISLIVGLILSLRLKVNEKHIERKTLFLNKKFTKYYVLEMFFGARKQVFLTFAPYVLIVQYGARTELLAFLYGVSSTINIFIAPAIGKLVDRLGYRLVIIVDTIALILICFGYGFAHRLFSQPIAFIVVCSIFVLDSVLFAVSIARTMYVKEMSESQNEVTSTLSTGISINHLISIVIAILGGVLWQHLGVEALFSLAALFGLGSFFFSLTLPKPGAKYARA